jgi:hypothetical protein
VLVRIVLTALSAVLGAASTVPYIRATFRRSTVPRIVTWLTWSLLTAVAGAASASAGDYPSAAFSLVGTVATGLVVLAGFRYGDRSVTRLDVVCLALVLTGFVLWLTFTLPGIAVAAACVIDFIGLVPTLVHGWRRPREETASTFVLIAVGGLCAAAASWGTWTVTALAYPSYVAISMGFCAIMVLLRRGTVAAAAGRDGSVRESTADPGRSGSVRSDSGPSLRTVPSPRTDAVNGMVRLRPAIPPA